MFCLMNDGKNPFKLNKTTNRLILHNSFFRRKAIRNKQ